MPKEFIVRGPNSFEFCPVRNKIAQSTQISLEAKGLWLDLVSRPPNWQVNLKKIREDYGIGRDKLYALLTELIDVGLMYRQRERKKMENGRSVLGGVCYWVFDDAFSKDDLERVYGGKSQKSVLKTEIQEEERLNPDFQYFEIQEQENSPCNSLGEKEAPSPYIHKKDREIKKQQQQHAGIRPRVSLSTESVVVPSFLLDIQDLTQCSAERLCRDYTERELERAAEMLAAEKNPVPNPYGWLKNCIDFDWQPKPSPEDQADKDREFLEDVCSALDGRVIGGMHVSVGRNDIAFSSGSAVKLFEVGQADFENQVKRMIYRLRKRE